MTVCPQTVDLKRVVCLSLCFLRLLCFSLLTPLCRTTSNQSWRLQERLDARYLDNLCLSISKELFRGSYRFNLFPPFVSIWRHPPLQLSPFLTFLALNYCQSCPHAFLSSFFWCPSLSSFSFFRCLCLHAVYRSWKIIHLPFVLYPLSRIDA